jgi:hypothetical protein
MARFIFTPEIPVSPVSEVTFGALTLSGAGGVFTDEVDGTYGQFTVSGGTLTPNTTPLTVGQTTVGDLTINVVANEYSVKNCAELQAAMRNRQASSATPTGGVTFRLRAGVTTNTNTNFYVDSTGATTPVFTTPVTIAGEPGAEIRPSFVLSHWSNVIIEGIKFSDPEGSRNTLDLGGAPFIFSIRGNCTNVTVRDCEIAGKYYDPLGTWAAVPIADLPEGYEQYKNSDVGMRTTTSGRGLPGGITIERCWIHDVKTGTTFTIGMPGGLVVRANLVERVYSDNMKYSVSSTAPGLTQILLDGATHEYNVLRISMGDPTDPGNPHIDGIQFISNSAVNGLLLENVVYRQNIFWETTQSKGKGAQGITSFVDGSGRIVFKNPKVVGNIMVLSGNHHVSMRVDGGIFAHNTLMRPGPDWDKDMNFAPRVNVDSAGGAAPNVFRNLTEGAAFGTVTNAENVAIGFAGATHSYGDTFVGPTWDHAELADLLAAFAPKSGGQAATNGVGSLGVGYGTIGTPRSLTGWTHDPDKEIPPT